MSDRENLREMAFELSEILEFYGVKVELDGPISFTIGEKTITVDAGKNLTEELRNEV